MTNQLTIVTLNIAAASKERALRLLETWLLPSSFDVYVLTETSEGPGTQLILDTFRDAGWSVFRRPTLDKDRGVAIVSRVEATVSGSYPRNDPAPGRSVIVELATTPALQLIGMYVPNRGNDPGKTERKRTFLTCWLKHLLEESAFHQHRILLGDLNVVPLDQQPQFLPQERFEYDWYRQLVQAGGLYDAALQHRPGHESTWVAHTGEGYTYDHIMPSLALTQRVTSFSYDHTPRVHGPLTDHSALIISVGLETISRLNLAARAVPTKQASLF